MSTTKNYALVTGATSGIGYELTKLLAKDGYNLIIVGRNQFVLESQAQEFAGEYGIEVVPVAKDLFKRDDAFSLYEDVRAKGLKVDILVNDAGQGQYGEFKDTDINRELAIIDLNIASLVILTKCFLKDMIASGEGKILNVASVASKLPGPWQSVYHATKAFVLSFTEAIREEIKDSGISITALMPGATDTDFFNKADMLDSKVVQDRSSLSNPADVAKDGYEALMAGQDKIISGFMNKMQVNISNVIPDSAVAHNVYEKQKPVEKD